MTWFRVDDTFYRSKKVRKLGADRVPCVGLWTLCGDWSADNLTDGFVPWEVVEDWDGDRGWAKRLVMVGLWDEVEVDGEVGVLFHDWADWQPTSDQVKQRRKADADRRARWREAKRRREAEEAAAYGPPEDESQCDADCDAPRDERPPESGLFDTDTPESRRDTPVSSRGASRKGSALPDPTRPDPTLGSPDGEPSRGRRKRRAHPLPDTWRPNENHARQARDRGVDLSSQARQFRNHAEMNDRRLANWDAGFRQWLEKTREFGPKPSRAQHQPAAYGWQQMKTGTDGPPGPVLRALPGGEDQ